MVRSAPAKRAMALVLCEPRGFCAGVERAIRSVEIALERFGRPIYVRHDIVHNSHVVERLRKKGAIFIEELEQVQDRTRPVIFSAHGVARKVVEQAQGFNLFTIDATCPLVTKVHREVQAYHRRGYHIILIGHRGHPEVEGSLGQLPDGTISLIETLEDARAFAPPAGNQPLAYVTQTTLSVDDTAAIVACLRTRYPKIKAPPTDDICYATTNRQQAVREVAEMVDGFMIVGTTSSSNSRRLVDVARRAGCAPALLVEDAKTLDFDAFTKIGRIGLSAGASAPEWICQSIIEAFRRRYDLTVEHHYSAREDMTFLLPKALRSAAGKALSA